MSPGELAQETVERHAGSGQPRWLAALAALLAVLAAVGTFLGSVRSTHALFAKSDATATILKASDAWNEYEARSIKQHIAVTAEAAAGPQAVRKLQAVASHERQASIPAQERARKYEHEAAEFDAESRRYFRAHEVIEVATALFEIGIVLISLTALLSSNLLRAGAIAAGAIGTIVLAIGVAL